MIHLLTLFLLITTGAWAEDHDQLSWQAVASQLTKPSAEHQKALQKNHEAFFELFFPLHDKTVPAETRKLAWERREAMYQSLQQNKVVKLSMLLFQHLWLLRSPIFLQLYRWFLDPEVKTKSSLEKEEFKKIRNFLKNIEKRDLVTSFHELNLNERQNLMLLLSGSEIEPLRRLALNIRMYYLFEIYKGQLGYGIAGINGNINDNQQSSNQGPSNTKPSLPKFKTHLSYNPDKAQIEGELDYIIVGSGPAGSMVGNQLHLNHKKVVILEKGPFLIPEATNGRNNFDFLLQKGIILNQQGDTILASANVAGGGSTVNFDIVFETTHPAVLNHFSKWRTNGLLSLNKKICDRYPSAFCFNQEIWTQDQLTEATEYVSKSIKLRTTGPEHVNANNEVLKDGATKLGYNWEQVKVTTNEFKMAYDLSQPYQQDIKTDKISALNAYVIPAMTPNDHSLTPLSFLPCAEVEKVLFEGKKAVGVQFTLAHCKDIPGTFKDLYNFKFKPNTKINIYAKRVILSAGAIGSTKILKQSRVQNSNIGKGIVIHPVYNVGAIFEKPINNHLGFPTSIYIDHFLEKSSTSSHQQEITKDNLLMETNTYPVNRWAVMGRGFGKDLYNYIKKYTYSSGIGIFIFEETRNENRLGFDREGKVKLVHHLSEKDRKRLARGIVEASRILLAAGALEVYTGTTEHIFMDGRQKRGEMAVLKTNDDLKELESKLKTVDGNHQFAFAGHTMGANKIGNDPKHSVVNLDHQVWGYPNLYVVDSSVFPSSVGANPMFTIYTMAYLFAQQHLKAIAPASPTNSGRTGNQPLAGR